MNISGVLYADPKNYYEVTYTPNVVYAHRETGDLTVHILTPCTPNLPKVFEPSPYTEFSVERKLPMFLPEERRFPLIVDVAGSGWSGAKSYTHVPFLAGLAQRGYVVACVGHRGTYRDDVRFPAAVQDVKEAIRFMRAHAEEYCVDVEHVALLGDSSGGHTAAMAALCGDEEPFVIGENLEQDSSVNACVVFYGPVDFENLLADRRAENKRKRPGEDQHPFELFEMFKRDFEVDPQAHIEKVSVMNYISKDKKLPNFIYLVGDNDQIIPLAQGDRFCEKIRACGGRADFYKISGAGHSIHCWNGETLEKVRQFLDAYI